jgi:hypothetical protein
MDKFKKYLKEESCAGSSVDVAGVETKLGKPLKRKKVENSEEIKEAVDFNSDGKIDINDLIFMTQNLGKNAIKEIIDLVASYLIKRYEEPSDRLPSDGVLRTTAYESVIRKVLGNKIIIKSSLPGYKVTSDGLEVRMTDAELKQRVLLAIDASKRRNARNRKVVSSEMDDLEEPFEDEIEDIDEPEDDLNDYEEIEDRLDGKI